MSGECETPRDCHRSAPLIWCKIKRLATASLFAPNLTMNLTYLCYGMGQI